MRAVFSLSNLRGVLACYGPPKKIEMMADTVLQVQTVFINQSNAMFSVSPAWINAKPSVEDCLILSDSHRSRGVVTLRGERPPTLTRWGAKKDVFVMKLGLPPAPQVQAPIPCEAQVPTPPRSPPQSDDEDDAWRYEC
jgi:hypothetical protein